MNTTADSERVIRKQAALFDVATHAVIATTLDGRIVYWSRGAERLYGWPAADVIGKNIVDVTPSDQAVDEASHIMAELRRGGTWSGEFRVRSRTQEVFAVSVRDLPIRDAHGELIGIIGISSRAKH
jgi:PAS domain S-box-containing protein